VNWFVSCNCKDSWGIDNVDGSDDNYGDYSGSSGDGKWSSKNFTSSYIYYLQALYTRVIFDEGGTPDKSEKNPCGMRKNNTSNKLSSHMTRAGIEPWSHW